MTSDLSAFYFDIRKDALYCDPISSTTRKACLTVLDHLFRVHRDLARADAAVHRRGGMARALSLRATAPCISNCSPRCPSSWRDDALAEKWRKVRNVRRVVTGAIEIERAQKRIGSSLEAAPIVYVSDPDLFAALADIDLAEVCITSAATLVRRRGSADGVPARRRRRRGGRGAAGARDEMRALLEDPAERRLRSGLSRRLAARCSGAARMGRDAQGGGVTA